MANVARIEQELAKAEAKEQKAENELKAFKAGDSGKRLKELEKKLDEEGLEEREERVFARLEEKEKRLEKEVANCGEDVRKCREAFVAAPQTEELLAQLARLRNSNQQFEIKVLYGKSRSTFLWAVDLHKVTNEDLKRKVHRFLKLPSDTTPDDMTLCYKEADDYFEIGEEDEDFRQLLKTCVSKSNFVLNFRLETVQKPFSEWRLDKVCDIFGLPSAFQALPKFDCGIDNLRDSKEQEQLDHLFKDLKVRQRTIPVTINEPSCREFVSPFLVTAAGLFDGRVTLHPELYIEGKYGCGPLDYCLQLHDVIVGIVEVKNELFNQGMAQALMQVVASLETNRRKRKRSEMEDQFIGKTYGIVTDSKSWWFVECTMDEDKKKFKIHSDMPASLEWRSADSLRESIGQILGRIVWLLKDAEKWMSMSTMDKKRRISEEEVV